MPALQLLRHLLAHRCEEALVVRRIVHVGEHEVLPHHHAQPVAGVVEGVILVGHRAGHAQHVHAGMAHLHQCGLVLRRGTAKGDHVQRRPAGTAAEHRHAVDAQREEPVVAIQLDGAEPDAAQVDDDRFRLAADLHQQPGAIQGRVAVRVRHHKAGCGTLSLASKTASARATSD